MIRFDRCRIVFSGIAVGAACLMASCSSGPKLHPVKGRVLYGDAPAEGATVVFHPKDGGQNSLTPYGTVQADGTFTLSTHPHGTGAPEGEYVVGLTWFPPDAREQDNPKNKLPDRYSGPGSPFKATIKAGPNELEPFRIPK